MLGGNLGLVPAAASQSWANLRSAAASQTWAKHWVRPAARVSELGLRAALLDQPLVSEGRFQSFIEFDRRNQVRLRRRRPRS